MKTNKLKFWALLVGIAMCASCSKEGEPGPQGPAGDQGIQGRQGPQGSDGPAGSGNVFYTDWTNLDFYEASSAEYLADWTDIPFLTEDIMESGFVWVYFRMEGESEIRPLPFLFPEFVVKLHVIHPNHLTIYTTLKALWTDEEQTFFRCVVIPGETAARKNLPDSRDYEAVKAYFNIPD